MSLLSPRRQCFRCQEFNWKTYSLAQSDRTIRQTQFEQCTSGDLCRILCFCQTSTNSPRHILCRSVSFQIERPTSSNEDTPPPNTFNTLVGVEIGEQVRKTTTTSDSGSCGKTSWSTPGKFNSENPLEKSWERKTIFLFWDGLFSGAKLWIFRGEIVQKVLVLIQIWEWRLLRRVFWCIDEIVWGCEWKHNTAKWFLYLCKLYMISI